ncbi:VOC family protein [Niabella pedocola]|uniref:VOC family protein n=1 Tax=Niabella pedocola TaxID=1752077 RepID=A0ABS8PRI4_9BACT|nr:VOC family protein [Niabella pedocola]MCD2423701.1 VOC family protein [Niabella pedocola]
MAHINPYITFNGNCEEAFNFYRSVFGGEFGFMGRFKDMPPQEGYTMPEADANRIMHISLPIGNTALMGSDTGGEWASGHTVGNNITISFNPDSKEEADRVFGALSEGGNATMPMADTFWGDYFGMCTDRFAINWMISIHTNPQ